MTVKEFISTWVINGTHIEIFPSRIVDGQRVDWHRTFGTNGYLLGNLRCGCIKNTLDNNVDQCKKRFGSKLKDGYTLDRELDYTSDDLMNAEIEVVGVLGGSKSTLEIHVKDFKLVEKAK